jgi:hypothetical protein
MSAVSSNFRGAVFMFAIVELSAQAVKPAAGHARGKLLARLARVARKVQHELRSWITERRSRRQ